jgi:hypothetical protein
MGMLLAAIAKKRSLWYNDMRNRRFLKGVFINFPEMDGFISASLREGVHYAGFFYSLPYRWRGLRCFVISFRRGA